jgi:heme A synthase
VLGIVQYQLELPSALVWVHVCLATLLWVGIVLAAAQTGSPFAAAREEPAESAQRSYPSVVRF